MYKEIIRPLLFTQDPERIHDFTLKLLYLSERSSQLRSLLEKMFSVKDPRLEVSLFGLNLENPFGIAAGLDKDCLTIRGLASFGPGFTEGGTVLPEPQSGNPGKRIARLVKDGALWNWMGFPSAGMAKVAQNLERLKGSLVKLGLNIGTNKETPRSEAWQDYGQVTKRLEGYASYIAVNVSSPNTEGLTSLQAKDKLERIVKHVLSLTQKPIFVKISPDLTEVELNDILEIASDYQLGIIATNTTVSKEIKKSLQTPFTQFQMERGGISGEPLYSLALSTVRYIAKRAPQIPLIGVGGIDSANKAWEMFLSGAQACQVFTGFIYGGPATFRNLNLGLLHKLEEHNVKGLSEIIGQGI